MMKRLLLLAALWPLALHSQPVQNVLPLPDCIVNIQFTAVGQTAPTSPNAGFNNISGGCTTWVLSIANSGFTGSPSVAIQSAQNTVVGGANTPGAYSTGIPNSSITSPSPNNVNPVVTTAAGFVWMVGYAPWVQAKMTAGTGSGTVTGTLLGYRTPSASVNGVTPASGTQTIQTVCPAAIPTEFTLVGTGYNIVVPVSGTKKIAICNIAITSASGGTPNVNTFTFGFGTTDCSSPTEFMNLAGVTGYTDNWFGSAQSAASGTFCVKESVANGDKVSVSILQN